MSWKSIFADMAEEPGNLAEPLPSIELPDLFQGPRIPENTRRAAEIDDRDRIGRERQLTAETGLPPDIVGADPKRARGMIDQRKFAEAVTRYPGIRKSAESSVFTAIALDDHEALSEIERQVRQTRNPTYEHRLQVARHRRLSWFDRNVGHPARGGWFTLRQGISRAQAFSLAKEAVADDASFYYGPVSQEWRDELTDMAIAAEKRARAWGERQEEVIRSPELDRVMREGSPVELITYLALNPHEIMPLTVESLVISAPSMAGAAAVGVLTAGAGIPVMLGAQQAAHFAGSYAVESRVALTAALHKAGLDPNDLTPAEFVDLLQNDGNFTAEIEKMAAKKGLAVATWEMIGAAAASRVIAPRSFAGRPLGSTTRGAVNLVAQTAVQGITEGAGEATGQAWAYGEVDWNEVVVEAAAGMGMAPVDVAVFGTHNIARAMGWGRQRADGIRRQREAAEMLPDRLREIGSAAGASRTRSRSPEQFRNFMAHATADSDIETVWARSGPLLEVLEANDEAAEILGLDIEDVRREAESDSFYPVSTATIITAGDDAIGLLEGIGDDIKAGIDNMTVNEAAAADEALPLEIANILDTNVPEGARAGQEAEIGDIRRQVMAQLEAAGRPAAEAEFLSAMFVGLNLASLSAAGNMSVAELWRRFPVDFQADGQDGVDIENAIAIVASTGALGPDREAGGEASPGAPDVTTSITPEAGEAVARIREAGLDPATADREAIRDAVRRESLRPGVMPAVQRLRLMERLGEASVRVEELTASLMESGRAQLERSAAIAGQDLTELGDIASPQQFMAEIADRLPELAETVLPTLEGYQDLVDAREAVTGLERQLSAPSWQELMVMRYAQATGTDISAMTEDEILDLIDGDREDLPPVTYFQRRARSMAERLKESKATTSGGLPMVYNARGSNVDQVGGRLMQQRTVFRKNDQIRDDDYYLNVRNPFTYAESWMELEDAPEIVRGSVEHFSRGPGSGLSVHTPELVVPWLRDRGYDALRGGWGRMYVFDPNTQLVDALTAPDPDTRPVLKAVHQLRPDAMEAAVKNGALTAPSIAIVREHDVHDFRGPEEAFDLVFRPGAIQWGVDEIGAGDIWSPTYPRDPALFTNLEVSLHEVDFGSEYRHAWMIGLHPEEMMEMSDEQLEAHVRTLPPGRREFISIAGMLYMTFGGDVQSFMTAFVDTPLPGTDPLVGYSPAAHAGIDVWTAQELDEEMSFDDLPSHVPATPEIMSWFMSWSTDEFFAIEENPELYTHMRLPQYTGKIARRFRQLEEAREEGAKRLQYQYEREEFDVWSHQWSNLKHDLRQWLYGGPPVVDPVTEEGELAGWAPEDAQAMVEESFEPPDRTGWGHVLQRVADDARAGNLPMELDALQFGRHYMQPWLDMGNWTTKLNMRVRDFGQTPAEADAELTTEFNALAEQFGQIVKNVLESPVEYFEAKPMRAVPMSDVALVVAPEGALTNRSEMVDRLRAMGIEVRERNGAAPAMVQSHPNALFRRRDGDIPAFYSTLERAIRDVASRRQPAMKAKDWRDWLQSQRVGVRRPEFRAMPSFMETLQGIQLAEPDRMLHADEVAQFFDLHKPTIEFTRVPQRWSEYVQPAIGRDNEPVHYMNLLIKAPGAFAGSSGSRGTTLVDQAIGAVQSHWSGEGDVIAHARVTVRDIPRMGTTYMIEEIQSDAHQEMRKQIAPVRQEIAELQEPWDWKKKELKAARRELAKLQGRKAPKDEIEEKKDEVSYLERVVEFERTEFERLAAMTWEGSTDIREHLASLEAQQAQIPYHGASDWPLIAFKAALEDAVHTTAQYVAWPSGAMVAEITAPGQVEAAEGMRVFYDQTLPRIANQYLKRWGVKVENTTGTPAGVHVEDSILGPGEPDRYLAEDTVEELFGEYLTREATRMAQERTGIQRSYTDVVQDRLVGERHREILEEFLDTDLSREERNREAFRLQAERFTNTTGFHDLYRRYQELWEQEKPEGELDSQATADLHKHVRDLITEDNRAFDEAYNEIRDELLELLEPRVQEEMDRMRDEREEEHRGVYNDEAWLWTFPITDQMRDDILGRGQELFSVPAFHSTLQRAIEGVAGRKNPTMTAKQWMDWLTSQRVGVKTPEFKAMPGFLEELRERQRADPQERIPAAEVQAFFDTHKPDVTISTSSRYGQYVQPPIIEEAERGPYYQELLVRVPDALKTEGLPHGEAGPDMLRSAQRAVWEHFDYNDLLIHVRVTQRDLPDVGETFFVEEIQSDAHQTIRQDIGSVRHQIKNLTDLLDSPPEGSTDAVMEGWKERREEERAKLKSMEAAAEGVPYAGAKVWPLMGFKAALDEAVKQGASSISWPSGHMVGMVTALDPDVRWAQFYNRSLPEIVAKYVRRWGVKPEKVHHPQFAAAVADDDTFRTKEQILDDLRDESNIEDEASEHARESSGYMYVREGSPDWHMTLNDEANEEFSRISEDEEYVAELTAEGMSESDILDMATENAEQRIREENAEYMSYYDDRLRELTYELEEQAERDYQAQFYDMSSAERDMGFVWTVPITDEMRSDITGQGQELFQQEAGQPAGPFTTEEQLLIDTLRRLNPAAGLEITDRVQDPEALGQYLNEVISIVDSNPDAMNTLRHEAIHSLRQMDLFTDQEWDALSAAAVEEDWIGKHNIRDRYRDLDLDEEAIIEEAVAEEFAQNYMRDSSNRTGIIRLAFEKIRAFFAMISAGLYRLGWNTMSANRAFQSVDEGRVGSRAFRKRWNRTTRENPSYQMRPRFYHQVERRIREVGNRKRPMMRAAQWLAHLTQQTSAHIVRNVPEVDEAGNPVIIPGGQPVMERAVKEEPVFDGQGNPVLDRDGKQRMKRVPHQVQKIDADGNPVVTQDRPATRKETIELPGVTDAEISTLHHMTFWLQQRVQTDPNQFIYAHEVMDEFNRSMPVVEFTHHGGEERWEYPDLRQDLTLAEGEDTVTQLSTPQQLLEQALAIDAANGFRDRRTGQNIATAIREAWSEQVQEGSEEVVWMAREAQGNSHLEVIIQGDTGNPEDPHRYIWFAVLTAPAAQGPGVQVSPDGKVTIPVATTSTAMWDRYMIFQSLVNPDAIFPGDLMITRNLERLKRFRIDKIDESMGRQVAGREIQYQDYTHPEQVFGEPEEMADNRETLVSVPAAAELMEHPVHDTAGLQSMARSAWQNHWDGPEDVLIHIRWSWRPGTRMLGQPGQPMRDTPIAGGGPVLLIEEIQSDFHQKIQKFTRTQGRDVPKLKSRFETESLESLQQGYRDQLARTQLQQSILQHGEEAGRLRWEMREEQGREALAYQVEKMQDLRRWQKRIPFAGTENWVRFALRLMLDEAVKDGGQRIAWTSGKMTGYMITGDTYHRTPELYRDRLSKQVMTRDRVVQGHKMAPFYDETVVRVANALLAPYGTEVQKVQDPELLAGYTRRPDDDEDVPDQIPEVYMEGAREDEDYSFRNDQEHNELRQPGEWEAWLERHIADGEEAADAAATLHIYPEDEGIYGEEVRKAIGDAAWSSAVEGALEIYQGTNVYGERVFETALDAWQNRDPFTMPQGFTEDDAFVWVIDIPDRMAEDIRNQGQPLYQKNDRMSEILGSYTNVGNGADLIKLMRGADVSTVIHEAAHYMLETMRGLDRQGMLDATVRAELFESLGVEAWAELRESHHEQFARSWETYIFDGELPEGVDDGLKGALQQASSMMREVYSSRKKIADGIPEDVKPEVVEFMDRMAAGMDSVEEAATEPDFMRAFKDAETGGMTEAEYGAYVKLVRRAVGDARIKMVSALMSDIRKENRQARKQAMKDAEAQAADIIGNNPAWIAVMAMRNGYNLIAEEGEEDAEGRRVILTEDRVRVDIDEARVLMGDRWTRLPRTMLAKPPRGLDPDVAAETFGFGSGREMLESIAALARPDARGSWKVPSLAQETRRVASLVLDRNMDTTLNEDRLEELARRALLDRDRSEQLALEIRLLDDLGAAEIMRPGAEREAAARGPASPGEAREAERAATGQARESPAGLLDVSRARAAAEAGRSARRLSRGAIGRAQEAMQHDIAAIRARAIEQVDRMPMGRVVQSLTWIAQAQLQSSRDKANAVNRGDLKEASAAARREIFQHHLGLQMARAKTMQDRGKRLFGQWNKLERKTAKSRHPAYIGPVWDLLALNGWRPSNLRPEMADELRDWVERRNAEGASIAVPDSAYRQKTRDEMTFAEFRDFHDAMRSLSHNAAMESKMTKAAWREEIDELVAKMKKNLIPRKNREYLTPATMAVRDVYDMAYGFFRKPENIFWELDGGENMGPVWEAMFRPLNEAQNREQELMEQAAKRFLPVWQWIIRNRRYLKRMDTVAGLSLTNEKKLAIALNWGNTGNREALLNESRPEFSMFNLNEVVNTLTAEEWDFVEGVWNLVDMFWEPTRKLELELTGVEPEKVEPEPFEVVLPDGSRRIIPGGYYPIVFDPDLSATSYTDMVQEQAKQLNISGRVRSATSQGRVIQRVGSLGTKRKVMLSLNVILKHLDESAHDIAFREPVQRVRRILNDREFRNDVFNMYGKYVLRYMEHWLNVVAAGTVHPYDFNDLIAHHLRTGMSIAEMGLSFKTSVMQLFGLSWSAEFLGPEYMTKGMNDWRRLTGGNPLARIPFVDDRSTYMRNRGGSYDREIADASRSLRIASRADVLRSMAFWHIGKSDMIVSYATWLGAYKKAVAEGKGEEDAIEFGDMAVRRSQGSALAKDMARAQTGSHFEKILTSFYTAYSAFLQLQLDSAYQARLNIRAGRRGRAARGLLASAMLLIVVPRIIQAVAIEGGPDDEDEWAAWVLKQLLSEGFSGLIWAREAMDAMTSGFGYSGPAALKPLQTATRFGTKLAKGDLDRGLLRDGLMTVGYFTHLPTRQVWRIIDALSDDDLTPAQKAGKIAGLNVGDR